MGQYRIYQYPFADVPYKHVYLSRDSVFREEKARKNTEAILEILREGERLEESLSRTKRQIMDLSLCNHFEYFCTFTFSAGKIDRYNFDVCSKKLRQFFNDFRKRHAPDFRYLIIPEFHKDGAVHFHGLCRGFPDGELVVPERILRRSKLTGEVEMVFNTPGYMDWPRYSRLFGHFNCSRIRNNVKCAFYITKYVTKDLCSVGKGRRAFMASQGLQRPLLALDMQGVGLMFQPEFANDYCAVAWDIAPEVLAPSPDLRWWDWEEAEDCDFSWVGEQISMEGFDVKTD